MVEMIRTATNMYNHGWDERNGGNISMLLDEAEVREYLDMQSICTLEIGFAAPVLDGRFFLVTGTGKYFMNVQYDPAKNLGIVRLIEDGTKAELLWGYTDGGRFTSEFPAHMMSHVARLVVDPLNRVVMHCHPGNLLAMTYVHDLDERAFTRTLWQMCTECIVVFPDGVNVLPWMLCAPTRSAKPLRRRWRPRALSSGHSTASTARAGTSMKPSDSLKPPRKQPRST